MKEGHMQRQGKWSSKWTMARTQDFKVKERDSQLDRWSAGRYDRKEEMGTD